MKFEVGKRYEDGSIKIEIISRTEKMLKYVEVQHSGKFNERKGEEKKEKINLWDEREVIITKCGRTIFS